MIKAYDLAFLNQREVASKKNTILRAYTLMTPQSILRQSKKSSLNSTKKQRRMLRAKTHEALLSKRGNNDDDFGRPE